MTDPQAHIPKKKSLSDTESRMGIIHERTVGLFESSKSWSRDGMIFPRCSSRLDISSSKPAVKCALNSSQLLFVPSETSVKIIGMTKISDFVVLCPDKGFMNELIAENQLDHADDQFLHSRCFKLKRSRWIDDLIERYLFERMRNNASPIGCTFFLEKQILNELARLIFTDKLQTHGDTLGEELAEDLSIALKYIEDHLADPLDLALISEQMKISASVLSRLFKNKLNTTPGAYIKERRLDEAAALIERGDYRISDVCMLVGYEDLSSFTRAFKAKFGVPPGSYREQAAIGIYQGR